MLAIIEKGSLMLRKLLFTVAAAATISVPLAGVALADKPSDPSSTDNGNGIGKGGMPQRLGDFAATGVTPPLASSNDPIPPGQEFNLAKDLFGTDPVTGKKLPTPAAVQAFESYVWTNSELVGPNGQPISIPSNPDDWTNITPGLAIKPLAPSCGKGRTGLPDNAPHCVP